ncbi:hypothetical protein ABT187_07840 [Streptomyces sp. NPDC001817]|uniref:hypothetical protein n=1 Tax=Streptomyces sp. NPDC001817 TaxID=3154398 RepID=UPI003317B644
MTRLSTSRRLALLAASTAVLTGGALAHGSAFAAAQWNKITDAPSGISVRLPGKPQVQKTTDNGVNCRDYVATTGYGAVGFSVFDEPGSDPAKPWDLKGGLKGAVDGYNSADPSTALRSTDVHDGTEHGDRYLEAKLVGAHGRTGHIRLVDHGRQAIMIMNVGTGDQRRTVDRDYQQVLHSIHAPDHGTPQRGAPAVAT